MTKGELVKALEGVDDAREVVMFWDGAPRTYVRGIYELDHFDSLRPERILVLCGNDYYEDALSDLPTRWIVAVPQQDDE